MCVLLLVCFILRVFGGCRVGVFAWFLTAKYKSVMGTALGLDSHVACVQSE